MESGTYAEALIRDCPIISIVSISGGWTLKAAPSARLPPCAFVHFRVVVGYAVKWLARPMGLELGSWATSINI